MALRTANYQSIGLLIGLATIGVIIIVGTVLFRGRSNQKQELPTKPFAEKESGLVFDAPTTWSVGSSESSTLRVQGARISKIQNQKSTCFNLSESASKILSTNLGKKSDQVIKDWKTEFPGLIAIKLQTSPRAVPYVFGIDTCSSSLNRRPITFRGQAYKNNVEVRFSQELSLDTNLSQSDLDTLARDLAKGSATTHQEQFDEFVSALNSLR
ncbi:hypothetical protein HYW32_04500 [Candidatus Berkelbacteria bacterium]|nr:hypothetical protein [Candidatus Berkelbacteria bacterium]